MRPKIAAAAGCLLLAAPGVARAGTITPIQYAYGGGSNAAAVIASRPPTAAATAGQAPAAVVSQSTRTSGAAATATAAAEAGGANGHAVRTAPQPLVGIAGAPAAPVASFDALHRAIPRDALWAVALAVACALGAWLVRRGST